MADIKTRNIIKKTIKSIDKSVIATEKFKSTIVKAKEKTESTINSDSNVNEDVSNRLTSSTNQTLNENVYQINKIGKNSLNKTKENFIGLKIKLKNSKDNKIIKESKKIASNNFVSSNIKNSKVVIKTNNEVLKKTEKISKESVKKSKRILNFAKNTAKLTIKNVKDSLDTSIKAIRSIVIGTKALISAIIAGGWVVIIFIILICLIGLFCSSVFGIFFSSEKMKDGDVTISLVIKDLNNEFAKKISDIQKNNVYDDYVINSNRSEWKDVLALYAVKVTNGNNNIDVITMDNNKIATLKEIFWQMNEIKVSVNDEMVNEETTDENGNIEINEVQKKILHIDITSKTVEKMADIYDFNSYQRKQLNELLNDKYSKLWSSVIYGNLVGNSDIVSIANSQLGNIGGEIYWRWYGFNSRVEWCAIFVSWAAEQTGYIESGIVPKFSSCSSGVQWFKMLGLWKDKAYIPKSGDIIFFDWEQDANVDHVGIVEKVEGDKVFTIEGNSLDECRRNEYDLNSNVIFGYGTPSY